MIELERQGGGGGEIVLNLLRLTPKLNNSSYQAKGSLGIHLVNDHTNIPNGSLRRGKQLTLHIHYKYVERQEQDTLAII